MILQLTKKDKAKLLYQNTICDCNDERICSPCRNGDYTKFIKDNEKVL